MSEAKCEPDAVPATHEPKSHDPFFALIGSSEWNACIGAQAEAENYLDGYMEAAFELVDAVIEKRMHDKRDTLVLPILYNARHAVELALKYTAGRLIDAKILTGDAPLDHDIASAWQRLSEAHLPDAALRCHIDDLQPFVRSLASIDDDGQALRYVTRTDGTKSMEDRSLANLEVIRVGLRVLARILDDLKHRTIDLVGELWTGTFTAECSRSDLYAIAKKLPHKPAWTTDDFTGARAAVMAEYHLTSNAFSRAVNKIKVQTELAGMIGIPSKPKHLTDELAILAVEQWRRLHPPRIKKPDDLGLDYFAPRDFDAMQTSADLEAEVAGIWRDTLTAPQLADLEVIYYLGRNRQFCEAYPEDLVKTLPLYQDGAQAPAKIRHLMEKTNLRDGLVTGLVLIGDRALAERIQAL